MSILEVTFLWSFVTIISYIAFKKMHLKLKKWWSTPIITASTFIIVIIYISHSDFEVYINSTHWLLTLLGPAVAAFAIPIYQRRVIIKKYSSVLAVGVVFGSALSIVSAWALASAFEIDEVLKLSLLPRSVSTPFAMGIAEKIGGVADLSALFVILTGVFGAFVGQMMLYVMPSKSKISHGASFGLGAHVFGSNKAYELDSEIGTISALVMVLTGVFNILVASLVIELL
jgi:putative effector of murein hydrolase